MNRSDNVRLPGVKTRTDDLGYKAVGYRKGHGNNLRHYRTRYRFGPGHRHRSSLAILSPTNIAPDLDLAALIGTHRVARKAPPRTCGCERRVDGILTCVGSGAKILTRGSAAEGNGDRRGKKARFFHDICAR